MKVDIAALEEQLNFEDILTPIAISFPYGKRRFTLFEATGDSYVEWQNAITNARVYDAEGRQVGFKNIHDVDHKLIAKCLVETLEDGTMQGVTEADVRGWPQRVLGPLYRTIRQISGLDDELTEAELLKERDRLDKKILALKNGSAEKNGQGSSTSLRIGSTSPPSSDKTPESS